MREKNNQTFWVVLIITQLIFIACFVFYLVLKNLVWGTGYMPLVPEGSTLYSLWDIMFIVVTLPGILSILGFIPVVIIEIVGIVSFFTRKRGALYLILVLEGIILEFFQVILAIIVLAGRQ